METWTASVTEPELDFWAHTFTSHPEWTFWRKPPKADKAATTFLALKTHSCSAENCPFSLGSGSRVSMWSPFCEALPSASSAFTSSGTLSSALQSTSCTADAQILEVSETEEANKPCSKEITSDAMVCATCPLIYGRLLSVLSKNNTTQLNWKSLVLQMGKKLWNDHHPLAAEKANIGFLQLKRSCMAYCIPQKTMDVV